MKLTAFILLIYAASPQAQVIVVDSTADDGSPGTLRWAINQHQASGTSQPVLISFDSSLSGQTIVLNGTPLPVIDSGDLSISGFEAPGLTITGNNLSDKIFRVGNVDGFFLGELRLSFTSGVGGGGCLDIDHASGLITISNTVFRNCRQTDAASEDGLGGAIRALLSASGALQILDSRFLGNRVTGAENPAFGGAVYVSGGTVIISRSFFRDNRVVDTDSSFTSGGAIYIDESDTTLADNEFLFNLSEDDSGAGGGVAINSSASFASLLRRNVFVGNTAAVGGALWHGTISIGDRPVLDMSQNTLLGNSTSSNNVGGAIYIREGSVRLRNNSFVDNLNSAGGAASFAYNPEGTTLTSVWNNLFGAGLIGPACKTFNSSPPVIPDSAGYNLVPDTSCSFNGSADIVEPTDEFFTLQNYGGTNRVIPPNSANPAIDAGNPAAADDDDWSTCPETDARGLTRPGDGDADGLARCDIGVFEWPDEAPLFIDGFEPGILLVI